jgi:hypothetical protein
VVGEKAAVIVESLLDVDVIDGGAVGVEVMLEGCEPRGDGGDLLAEVGRGGRRSLERRRGGGGGGCTLLESRDAE